MNLFDVMPPNVSVYPVKPWPVDRMHVKKPISTFSKAQVDGKNSNFGWHARHDIKKKCSLLLASHSKWYKSPSLYGKSVVNIYPPKCVAAPAYKNVFRPGKPPENQDLLHEEAEGDSPLSRELCHCERHNWSPHYKRAKHLKEKERAYREAMIQVASERAILENEILQHPCTDLDEALSSLYAADYMSKGFPMADYRAMKKDHADPIATPVAMLKDPRETSYRDVSTFKTIAISPPNIWGPRSINFNEVRPKDVSENLYTSEYAGRISKAGYTNYQSSQRFRKDP